jgi:hypothetical protein
MRLVTRFVALRVLFQRARRTAPVTMPAQVTTVNRSHIRSDSIFVVKTAIPNDAPTDRSERAKLRYRELGDPASSASSSASVIS